MPKSSREEQGDAPLDLHRHLSQNKLRKRLTVFLHASQIPTDSLFDVGDGLFFRAALGIAPFEQRATYHEEAVLVLFNGHRKLFLHTLILSKRRRRVNYVLGVTPGLVKPRYMLPYWINVAIAYMTGTLDLRSHTLLNVRRCVIGKAALGQVGRG